MHCQTRINENALIITLPARFTFNDNQSFHHVLKSFPTKNIEKIEMDMAGTEFMDSAALGMLLIAKDEAEKAHKPLTLKKPSGYVRKLFQVSKFYEVFQIED